MKLSIVAVTAACLAAGLFWQAAQADSVSACEKGEISRNGQCEDSQISTQPENKQGIAGSEATAQEGAFPSTSCRFGYSQVGARLCMTGARGPDSFANALAQCQASFGRVADYGDWRYRILYGDGVAAPVGWWLGPITADNVALFVNLPNTGDFDGETSRFDSRYYACAHDDTF